MKTNGLSSDMFGDSQDIDNVFIFSPYNLGGAMYYPFQYEMLSKDE